MWGKCGERKRKNPRRARSARVSCTRSRGRTGTSFRTLVFETNASTDSAIRAGVATGGRAAAVELDVQRYCKLSEKTRCHENVWEDCVRML